MVDIFFMAKMRWGNGESKTGGNPYVEEHHQGAAVKDAFFLEPYISFGDLAARFDTDAKYILIALQNRGVKVDKPTDMLTRADERFIEYTFEAALREEIKQKRYEDANPIKVLRAGRFLISISNRKNV